MQPYPADYSCFSFVSTRQLLTAAESIVWGMPVFQAVETACGNYNDFEWHTEICNFLSQLLDKQGINDAESGKGSGMKYGLLKKKAWWLAAV